MGGHCMNRKLLLWNLLPKKKMEIMLYLHAHHFSASLFTTGMGGVLSSDQKKCFIFYCCFWSILYVRASIIVIRRCWNLQGLWEKRKGCFFFFFHWWRNCDHKSLYRLKFMLVSCVPSEHQQWKYANLVIGRYHMMSIFSFSQGPEDGLLTHSKRVW